MSVSVRLYFDLRLGSLVQILKCSIIMVVFSSLLSSEELN